MRGPIIGLVAVTVTLMTVPAHAMARKDKPTQITPGKVRGKQRRQARRTETDRSEGGTRRGVLELSLGSVVLASSALLIGRGAWEIVTSRRLAEECESGRSDSFDCFTRPRRQGGIAAGLSFGFSGILALAGGFLLTRGIRIHRDYRKWSAAQARLTVTPWARVRQPSAGVAVQLRF